ncbi:MAG TPA: hypothetical protein DEB31_11625 [Clostridiales bacterium]|nr:hypothetical protein [Clostridiales bacterium]
MPDLERVKKYQNYLFLNITPKAETPSWKRVGTATDFAAAMNGETETFDYIADESPTTELKTYKPTIAQTQTAYIGDPIFDYVFDLYNRRATGSDAVGQGMLVYQQKAGMGDDAGNVAVLFDALITIDTYDIVAGTITYTIEWRGTPVNGTAKVVGGEPAFTAAA